METFDPSGITSVSTVGSPVRGGLTTRTSGTTLGGVVFACKEALDKSDQPTGRKYADVAVVPVETEAGKAVIFCPGGDGSMEYGGQTHRTYRFTSHANAYTNNGHNLAEAIRDHLGLDLLHETVPLVSVEGEDSYAAIAPPPHREAEEA